jgi:hypothetical protein
MLTQNDLRHRLQQRKGSAHSPDKARVLRSIHNSAAPQQLSKSDANEDGDKVPLLRAKNEQSVFASWLSARQEAECFLSKLPPPPPPPPPPPVDSFLSDQQKSSWADIVHNKRHPPYTEVAPSVPLPVEQASLPTGPTESVAKESKQKKKKKKKPLPSFLVEEPASQLAAASATVGRTGGRDAASALSVEMQRDLGLLPREEAVVEPCTPLVDVTAPLTPSPPVHVHADQVAAVHVDSPEVRPDISSPDDRELMARKVAQQMLSKQRASKLSVVQSAASLTSPSTLARIGSVRDGVDPTMESSPVGTELMLRKMRRGAAGPGQMSTSTAEVAIEAEIVDSVEKGAAVGLIPDALEDWVEVESPTPEESAENGAAVSAEATEEPRTSDGALTMATVDLDMADLMELSAVVTKHSWKGRLERLLSISNQGIATRRTDRDETTNYWSLDEVVETRRLPPAECGQERFSVRLVPLSQSFFSCWHSGSTTLTFSTSEPGMRDRILEKLSLSGAC